MNGPDAVVLVQRVLSGDLKWDRGFASRLLRRLADGVKAGLFKALATLAAPVLAALCLKLTLGAEDGAFTLLCRLACACGLVRHFADAAGLAARAMSAMSRLAKIVSPILAAALTLTGASASAAALTPLSGLCAAAIEDALTALGLPLCALGAAIAACAHLSDSFSLGKLFKLVRQATVWGVRGLLAAFTAVLAVQGRLAAAQDTLTVQVAQRALRGVVPFVGRSVSDSTGALLESAVAARNAVGVTGMLVALGVCFRPVFGLTVHTLSLRLASAAIEPMADRGIAEIVSDFGDVSRMLLALCVGSAILTALLSGACLGLLGNA